MIVLASVVAIALIVAQALAVWGFLRFVHSFGAYTESQRELTSALLTAHESNRLVHLSNLRMLEQLQALHLTKEVA